MKISLTKHTDRHFFPCRPIYTLIPSDIYSKLVFFRAHRARFIYSIPFLFSLFLFFSVNFCVCNFFLLQNKKKNPYEMGESIFLRCTYTFNWVRFSLPHHFSSTFLSIFPPIYCRLISICQRQ